MEGVKKKLARLFPFSQNFGIFNQSQNKAIDFLS